MRHPARRNGCADRCETDAGDRAECKSQVAKGYAGIAAEGGNAAIIGGLLKKCGERVRHDPRNVTLLLDDAAQHAGVTVNPL